jgi:hypothetical protein
LLDVAVVPLDPAPLLVDPVLLLVDPELLLVDPELLLVDPELLAAVVPALEATVAAVDFDRPGSCPLTSTTVISSQAATNSASEPAMIRRRIERTRPRRACLIACARARGASELMSVMVFGALAMNRCQGGAVRSFLVARIKGVSEG